MIRSRTAALNAIPKGDLLLIVVFAVVTGWLLAPYIKFPWAFGGDARIYTEATGIWLAGGDPWGPLKRAAVTFAGPPHALIFFIPFVSLPPVVTGTVWAIGLLVVSTIAIRRIGLPMWWLLFPPLSNAIMVGSLDALAFSLLVVGGGWLAPIAKPYAAFGLLAERRWRDLLAAAVVGLGLLLLLPWQRFVAQFDVISASLARNAEDLSSFGEPIAMVIAAIALASLGWRRALWLSTPVWWPSTQLHYAAVSIPGLTRAAALFFALPIPGAPLAGVVAAAVLARLGPHLDPSIVPEKRAEPASSASAAPELAVAR